MRKIILSLSVTLIALLITIGTNSCMGTEPASGPARSAEITLTASGSSAFCFPPLGGFDCDIVIWTSDGSPVTTEWRKYDLDENDFYSAGVGNTSARRIRLGIPQSGQFHIRVTLTSKTCQNGCCSRCSSTDPPWTGRTVYIGNLGMVENRGWYTIPVGLSNCICC